MRACLHARDVFRGRDESIRVVECMHSNARVPLPLFPPTASPARARPVSIHALHRPCAAARDTLTSDLVAIWRMRLAVGLLHARVGYIEETLDKIGGVPARSATLANSLGAANLISRIQELGRPGGGEQWSER